MAWLEPTTAPKTGRFIAKFKSERDYERIVILERNVAAQGNVIGVAGGLFEFDMGTMLGWHPLPEGLE